VQFIPEIAPDVAKLYVFQRTANWVLPKDDQPYSREQIEHLRANPAAVEALRRELYDNLDSFITFSDPNALRAAERAGLDNLKTVTDPEVRRRLTPDHPFGCKRPLASNVYYPAFNEPHVELVTTPIRNISPRGIVTEDARERSVDTLILATGFHTGRYLSAIEVTGRHGLGLEAAWNEGAQAYLGMTTAGFPNLFMLYGPNTNNGSIIFMIEQQVDYVLRQIERLERERLAWLDVREEVMNRFNDALQRDIEQVEVWQAGCSGYYRAPSGRVVTQWPHTMSEFARRVRQDDAAAFHHG
ncbi:MAG: flavin-containing monooxygenase, partial [Pseudomonadota bacterium]